MQAIKFNAVSGDGRMGFWGGVKKCLPQIKTGHLIKPETGVRVLLAHIYTGRHVLSAKQCNFMVISLGPGPSHLTTKLHNYTNFRLCAQSHWETDGKDGKGPKPRLSTWARKMSVCNFLCHLK